MRLARFQVEDFRNFVDSTTIEIEPNITCLVGKNESGKTALLQALYRVNPVVAEKFNISLEYPRWKLSQDRKGGVVEDAYPVTAWFEIEPDDSAEVGRIFGPGVLTGVDLSVRCRYEQVPTISTNVDETRAVRNAVQRAAPSHAGQLAAFTHMDTLRKAANDATDSSNPVQSIPSETLGALRGEIEKIMHGSQSLQHAVARVLYARIPQFFYFSDYSILKGRVSIPVLAAAGDRPQDPSLRTTKALLELVDTTTSDLASGDFEDRMAEIEAASNNITDEVFEYWKQNRDLSIEMRVEREEELGERGQPITVPYLDIRVKDNVHRFTSNFDLRSSGFKWFFSFVAAFSEFDSRPDRMVILLDEPGLSLHGKAQADYLRFISERLGERHTVIYSTHSPFMVEVGHPERIRVVEDKGARLGAVVLDSALARDSDSLFPLQAALGYDIAQSLFIGPHNLVVEGTSDFAFFIVLSDHLKALGRVGLDGRWRIVPAGGAANIPAFVALVGPHLDVTVIADSGSIGMQRLQDLQTRGLLRDQRLILISEITGEMHSDVEDLFAAKDYLRLYNGAFSAALTVPQLPPGDRILGRIERAVGTKFDHGLPSDFLLRKRGTLLRSFSNETRTRFERLFVRVNATLPA